LLKLAMGLGAAGGPRGGGGGHPDKEVGKGAKRDRKCRTKTCFAQMLKTGSISTNCSKLGRN